MASLFPICTAKVKPRDAFKNSEIQVVFPHDSGLGPDRCDTSCTEGSLGRFQTFFAANISIPFQSEAKQLVRAKGGNVSNNS